MQAQGGLVWRDRLLELAERRLPALTRRKLPEALPIVLHRRRIYVLPTRFGLFFGFLLTAMTLGALNYNNNPALMLCFLLASTALTSLLRGYLDLKGLRLTGLRSEPVHAGGMLVLHLEFATEDTRLRRGLRLRSDRCTGAFDLADGQRGEARVELPAMRRGWMSVGRMELSTMRPLGLFVVWSWLHPELRVLVFPQLDSDAPPLPRRGQGKLEQPQRGQGEHPHALREYRSGDPLRLVAWKRSAQAGRLLVREFELPRGGEIALRWDDLAGMEREARIRRLARWLVDAEREGLRSLLVLPGERFGPGRGPAHLHACLRALALLPQ